MTKVVLEIRTSPHVLSGNSVDSIMFNVVLALLPVTGFAIYAFGLTALATLCTAVGSCVGFEYLLCKLSGKDSTVGDWSAVITGLLYGLTLPPGLPLWMVCVGGVICIGVGKALFGGLGANPFNPALVGRAILQATFPVPMTTWLDPFRPDRFAAVLPSSLTAPFTRPEVVVDAVSGATPLSAWKFGGQLTEAADLVMGYTSGSTGETCAVLILLGGLWLVARKMMNWRIPVSILATVAALSGAVWLLDPQHYPSPLFMLLSGGLMLGAVFMATDMVGSPLTGRGCALYGVLIGGLVVVIRLWGGMPEGVMYAILLGNAVVPHIDNWLRPRVYGTSRKPAPAGAKEGS
ncbi:RnfABCDGE type electron transport complex subunit D [Haliangium sp.]|uniref:RnfABCDGE type electron transport complex subunit D n=1 Tax=Haliangium sp. TaxID=2663208 RepID=UPI003D10A41B